MKRTIFVAAMVAALAVPLFFHFTADASPPVGAGAPLQMAPDFKITDLQGDEVSMSRLRGKVVIVNFWATWCPPCRHEIPWFIELQKRYGPDGLQIVGISLDAAGPAHVAQFAKEMGINYTIAMGDRAIAARFGGVDVLPSTFYIGRDGKIVRSVPGLMRKEQIEAIVTNALGVQSGSRGRTTR